MRAARCPALRWITVASLVALCVAGAPAAAQQPAPTPPATPAPTAALPTPTVAPVTPTPAPAPEPTLTIPQAIDRIISGERPVETLVTLIAQRPPLQFAGLLVLVLLVGVVVAAMKPWRERFVRRVELDNGGPGVRHSRGSAARAGEGGGAERTGSQGTPRGVAARHCALSGLALR
ncbi:MAG: hypothetical protein NZ699_09620 [Roseiflexus sp.]|nr:hypothetical protein [Roseiflexus sp.]MDW8145105.1 hypothetical protein [Roseiflexaceae bacterium]MDW8233311.1 hypothetical protein [Roseiflexaceae bacterium]